jgi:hypothetical protein
MVMLGDMLAAARDSSSGFQAWLERSDAALAVRITEAASESGITPTQFVRSAIADFDRYAAEEDWATLTSSLRDTDDPGTVCLLAMVHWRLTVRGCDNHSHRHIMAEPPEKHP